MSMDKSFAYSTEVQQSQSRPYENMSEYPSVVKVHSQSVTNAENLGDSPIQYTSLHNVPPRTQINLDATATPGPEGFEPKYMEPPSNRYEYRDLQETTLYLDYREQENTLGVGSKLVRTYGHRFWGEFFAILMPISDFVFALILEAIGYVSRVAMHIFLGITVRISDYILKPYLVFMFNFLLLPSLTHANTLLRTMVRVVKPCLELAERLLTIVAIPIRALRLVDVKIYNYNYKPNDNDIINA